MNEKDLRKLSREELLKLLLIQTKEVERLRHELELAQTELADRRVRINNFGNLAEAVMEINGVMAAAQSAANQYLESIMAMEEETRMRCVQMLQAAGGDYHKFLVNHKGTGTFDESK